MIVQLPVLPSRVVVVFKIVWIGKCGLDIFGAHSYRYDIA